MTTSTIKSTKIFQGKYEITKNGKTLGFIVHDEIRKFWLILDENGEGGAVENTKWQAMLHFSF